MKKKDFVLIKNLNVSELLEKAGSLKKDIADLHMDKNMKKLKDLKSVGKKRRERAAVLTILRQKQLLEQLSDNLESGGKK
jgi:ribosomal protein L29